MPLSQPFFSLPKISYPPCSSSFGVMVPCGNGLVANVSADLTASVFKPIVNNKYNVNLQTK
jgi:hypothetical protein